MFGGRPAAAAHHAHTRSHKLASVAGHVLGRAKIDVPALHRARHSGVRLCGQWQDADRTHALDGVQHCHRAHAAIAAKDVGAPFGEPGRESFRSGTVQAVTVFVDGDLSNDRDLRVYIPSRQDCLVELLKVAEGLQDQQIYAALNQGCDLLAEGGASFLERSLAQWLNPNPQRPDRARYPDVEALGGFPCHSRPGQIDVVDPCGHAVARQAKGICPESIGFNDLRTRLQILVMYPADEVRL